MDPIDWLQQQEHEAWKTRIRQLRRELSEQRLSRGTVELARKEESSEAPQPRTAPQEVAPPPLAVRQQKPVRPLS